ARSQARIRRLAMQWMTRLIHLFRQRRLNAELDEELASHVAEAIEQGRSPEDARRAFGSALHHREQSRDVKLLPRLEALASDVVFGSQGLESGEQLHVARPWLPM